SHIYLLPHTSPPDIYPLSLHDALPISMAPPTRVNVDASTRNCHRIARRVAPSALRTPISRVRSVTEIIMIATTPTHPRDRRPQRDRKSTRLNSSHDQISYAVFCLKKKT